MGRNLFVRREVETAKAYSPGLSVDEIRDLYGLERIIKLASNENPLGASPMARRAVERAAGSIFRYAQSGSPRLAEAIAAMHRVKPECVALGNGSDEVIDLLIRCRAEPGRHNIVTFKPCYSLYALQAGFCGVELRTAPLRKDFSFDWEALLTLVDGMTSLVFVTTPDNPSGYCPPARELEALAGRLPAETLLVLDEAYMDFAAYADGAVDGALADYSLLPRFNELNNVIILRTFSKSYGLAGLRLGYGLMPAALAGYLRRVRLPFSVNTLAEAAGLAVLRDRDFHLASLREVERGRALLSRELTGLGCPVYPSLSNFIMFSPPPGASLSAAGLFDALLRRGVILRRLDSYGLPEFLRVSVGKEEENILFLEHLQELLAAV
ncbi:MAG: histidinol-phosphate transaminase [Deltaproteobacteria bacterium]|nr:histidinol-phosphate transaminase [Deltaproteobacteria bacterium]